MRAGLVFIAIALFALLTGQAQAQRAVSTLSNTNVEITSSFDGERLTFFGNIEAEAGSNQPVSGPFQVIIVITGPLTDRVARLKTHNFGIWLNTEQVTFRGFPSYFHVMASARLSEITDPVTLDTEGISPEAQAMHAAPSDWWDAAVYSRQLVRLMTQRGFFGVEEQGVQFLSDTAYVARLTLPHDVPNGSFLAQTYVFKNGALLSRRTEGFSVRKIGFERFLGNAARDYPLPYGLVCVALALFTGWLGGVVFRR